MWKTLYFFIALLTLSFCAEAQSFQQQKLLDIESRRFLAMLANDTSILSKYLADDLVFIHSNGTVDTKTSLLKAIASGGLHYQTIVPEKRSVSIEGNFAWVYGTATLSFNIGTSPVPINTYISFIDFFRLNRVQWQEVVWQSAKINRMGNYDSDTVKPQAKPTVQPSIY